jgi:D-hexose-6-phosphate mutarotase
MGGLSVVRLLCAGGFVVKASSHKLVLVREQEKAALFTEAQAVTATQALGQYWDLIALREVEIKEVEGARHNRSRRAGR